MTDSEGGTHTEQRYEGRLYSLVFDRLLLGLHQWVAGWVEEGTNAVDVCCGSGGLTFQLASRCRRVEGVDLSPPMIAQAERLLQQRGLEHVSFRVGDATRLEWASDGSFDVATVAMGLHEMPTEVRLRVIPELLRVAERAVIVDFAVPMPHNISGWRNRTIEFLGGRTHFAGFRDYTRRGGLPTLIEAAGARIVRERKLDRRTLHVVELSR